MLKSKNDDDILHARETIKLLETRKQLVDFALRLKRDYPDIDFLAYECLDKCLKKNLVNRNVNKLPKPNASDNERTNIELVWRRAVAATNILSIATLSSVKKHGYLLAMVNQLNDINSIGTGGFERLKKYGFPEFSAEYIIRKYYPEKLSEQHKSKIDLILKQTNLKI